MRNDGHHHRRVDTIFFRAPFQERARLRYTHIPAPAPPPRANRTNPDYRQNTTRPAPEPPANQHPRQWPSNGVSLGPFRSQITSHLGFSMGRRTDFSTTFHEGKIQCGSESQGKVWKTGENRRRFSRMPSKKTTTNVGEHAQLFAPHYQAAAQSISFCVVTDW